MRLFPEGKQTGIYVGIKKYLVLTIALYFRGKRPIGDGVSGSFSREKMSLQGMQARVLLLLFGGDAGLR